MHPVAGLHCTACAGPCVSCMQLGSAFVPTCSRKRACLQCCPPCCRPNVRALQAWLPVGAAAGYCECQADSARIDMRLFERHMMPALRREVNRIHDSSVSCTACHVLRWRGGLCWLELLRGHSKRLRLQAAAAPLPVLSRWSVPACLSLQVQEMYATSDDEEEEEGSEDDSSAAGVHS